MNVNKLIKKLQAEKQYGNGELEVIMVSHDCDPLIHDHGEGPVITVRCVTNDISETFVVLSN